MYEGASARYGRVSTIGLMLKSYETLGCRRGYLASLGCPAPPGTPGGDAPGPLGFTWKCMVKPAKKMYRKIHVQ